MSTRRPTTPPMHPASSPALLEQLFDHVHDLIFFIKDTSGRYLAVNESMVQRCGCRHKSDLIGRRASEVYPRELGGAFARQDDEVLRTGKPILDRLELHLYARRRPGWCLTTKLPMHDETGRITGIIGIIGISRDLRGHQDVQDLPAGITAALEHLEKHVGDTLSPAILARVARLPAPRFARHIKRIFRLTPMQLITNARLAAASRLLCESRQSVADIALACGFCDHSAFTRAFRLATSMTPTAFRESTVKNGG
jgi:AraC-like DNA-binding protein